MLQTREVTDDQITPSSTAEALVALDADRFYPLTGPVRIEGAAPGDTLAPGRAVGLLTWEKSLADRVLTDRRAPAAPRAAA